MKNCVVLVLSLLVAGRVAAQSTVPLTNDTQRISYALGMEAMRQLQIDDFELDLKTVVQGMSDAQAGRAALTPLQTRQAMREMKADILAKAVAKKEAAGEVHKKAGAAFLAENLKKPGVLTKTVTAPDGTTATLQYRILNAVATGDSPKLTDTVTVKYRGTLIDGTVFDVFADSVKHGDTAVFDMKDVIPGWAAALQRMKPGEKWQLFVPPSLAYADYGPPEIGIHTTLIYELELVSFAPTPAAKNNPL
ncbi:MAG TPA: FKBP-type peptidyl-prolyl cis-trans isomerase [Verrucomicrobiae bacterium]